MTNSDLWNSCSAYKFSNDDIVQGAGGVYVGFAKHAFHMRNSYHLSTKKQRTTASTYHLSTKKQRTTASPLLAAPIKISYFTTRSKRCRKEVRKLVKANGYEVLDSEKL